MRSTTVGRRPLDVTIDDMSRKAAHILFTVIAFALASDVVSACRPRIVDPLRWLEKGDEREPPITRVFVGEVVGIRVPHRAEVLRQWRKEQEEDPHLLYPMVVGGGVGAELEVFPREVLSGEVDYPHATTMSSCTDDPPTVGDEILVFETSEGWSIVQARPESAYDLEEAFNLHRVRACLAGDCEQAAN